MRCSWRRTADPGGGRAGLPSQVGPTGWAWSCRSLKPGNTHPINRIVEAVASRTIRACWMARPGREAPVSALCLLSSAMGGTMRKRIYALGGAGLLLSVSMIAAQAQTVTPTTPPDPPTFEAQGTPNFVGIKDMFEYKALAEYKEPQWVTS